MTLPRVLAIPAALVVVLTVVGAWVDGSRFSSASAVATTVAAPTSTTSTPPPPGAPGHTSCRSVVHVGDSTSVGLMSSDYLTDPGQRIDAQYADVGVTEFHDEIKGARSIV